jgi:hypothetical protein
MSPVSDGSPDVVLKISRTRVGYSSSLPPTAPTTKKERTKSRPNRMMREATDKAQEEASNAINHDSLTNLDEEDSEKRRSIDLDDLMSIEKFATSMGRSPNGSLRGSGSHRSSFARRQSLLLGSRRMSSQVIMEERQEDADARNIYDAEPPAELITEEDDFEELGESWHQDDVALPRASLLNRARKLESLRKLASGEDEEEEDSFRDTNNFTPTSRTSMSGRRGPQRGGALSNMMVPVASFFKAVSSFGPDPNDSYGNFGESATLDLMEEGSVETDYLLNDSSNQSRKGSLSSVQSSSSTERRNQQSPRVRNQGQ